MLVVPMYVLRMGDIVAGRAVCARSSLERAFSATRFRLVTRFVGAEYTVSLSGYASTAPVLAVSARAGGWSADAATWWSCLLAANPFTLALAGTLLLLPLCLSPSEGNARSVAMICV